MSPERPCDYPIKAPPYRWRNRLGPQGREADPWARPRWAGLGVCRSQGWWVLSLSGAGLSDGSIIRDPSDDYIQLRSCWPGWQRCVMGTELAPECGTTGGWQGNQSGPSATGSGFPLVTWKSIRAQNSGQGAFILRATLSLAGKALETGTKAEGALPDLSPSKPCALREHRGPSPACGGCLASSSI